MDPFIGEIRIFPYEFAPRGWAFCNGQLLPLSGNTELFSLLGTTYGGDGRVSFGLPNLQRSVPLGAGQGPGHDRYELGQNGGQPNVQLTMNEMPPHNHGIKAQTVDPGDNRIPAPNLYLGNTQMYSAARPTGTLNVAALGFAGGSVAHNNQMPYLALSFCIATDGIFPPRPGDAD